MGGGGGQAHFLGDFGQGDALRMPSQRIEQAQRAAQGLHLPGSAQAVFAGCAHIGRGDNLGFREIVVPVVHRWGRLPAGCPWM